MCAKKTKTRIVKSKKSISKGKPAKGKQAKEPELSDKELRKIQKELKSSMGRSMLIEQDIKRLKDRLDMDRPLKAGSTLFRKDFVFKCGKCVGEFRHTANVAVIDHKVVCPKCRKEHLLQISPHAGEYRVKLPKSIKLVK
jgi:hypothetical protein